MRQLPGIGLRVILYHGRNDELRRDSAWQLDFSQARRDQLTVYLNLNFMNLFPGSASSLTNLLVSGNNPVTRARAADGLIMGWFYPDLVPAVRTVLTNALRDPDNGVRMAAASTLGHARDHREMIVPALRQALSDPDPSVRGNAATSLGAFGADAKDAVPEMLKLLDDPKTYPKQRSAEMVLKIDPEAAAKAGVKGQGNPTQGIGPPR